MSAHQTPSVSRSRLTQSMHEQIRVEHPPVTRPAAVAEAPIERLGLADGASWWSCAGELCARRSGATLLRHRCLPRRQGRRMKDPTISAAARRVATQAEGTASRARSPISASCEESGRAPMADGAGHWTFSRPLARDRGHRTSGSACEHLRVASAHAVAPHWFKKSPLLRHDSPILASPRSALPPRQCVIPRPSAPGLLPEKHLRACVTTP